MIRVSRLVWEHSTSKGYAMVTMSLEIRAAFRRRSLSSVGRTCHRPERCFLVRFDPVPFGTVPGTPGCAGRNADRPMCVDPPQRASGELLDWQMHRMLTATHKGSDLTTPCQLAMTLIDHLLRSKREGRAVQSSLAHWIGTSSELTRRCAYSRYMYAGLQYLDAGRCTVRQEAREGGRVHYCCSIGRAVLQ